MAKGWKPALGSLSLLTLLVPACDSPGSDPAMHEAALGVHSAEFTTIKDPIRQWPIFFRGTTYTTFYASDDGLLFARDHGATSWRTWYDFSSLGWSQISYPGAASWGGGRIDVFNVDRGSNTMLHTYAPTLDGAVSADNWGAPPPGYTFFGKPDASSWGDQRIDVFCAARDAGGRTVLMHKAWDHGRVYGWESYGAPPNGLQLSGALTATSWGAGRIDLFALTDSSPPRLVHSYTNTGAPGPWEEWPIAAGMTLQHGNANAIDVASWGSGRLDLFALDENGTLDHLWYDNGASGWDNWGNPAPSRLGRISVVATESQSLILSAQDSPPGLGGPNVWEDAWLSGPSPWRSSGKSPEAEVQLVSGGFDISHW